MWQSDRRRSQTSQDCLILHIDKSYDGVLAFVMPAEVRVRAAASYAATVPAGQAGLWCGNVTGNGFDDFRVRDMAGPYAAASSFSAHSVIAVTIGRT